MNNLEGKFEDKGKIPTKNVDKITCDVPITYCEVHGSYFKCYEDKQVYCGIYRRYHKKMECEDNDRS